MTSNEEVLERVEIEGLEYALLDYLSWENIEDVELRELVKVFKETRDKIEIVLDRMESELDIELEEVSHVGTNTTPASFLTRPNISFTSKDIEITNIKKENDQIKISLLKKNRKDAGEFSIIFNKIIR